MRGFKKFERAAIRWYFIFEQSGWCTAIASKVPPENWARLFPVFRGFLLLLPYQTKLLIHGLRLDLLYVVTNWRQLLYEESANKISRTRELEKYCCEWNQAGSSYSKKFVTWIGFSLSTSASNIFRLVSRPVVLPLATCALSVHLFLSYSFYMLQVCSLSCS